MTSRLLVVGEALVDIVQDQTGDRAEHVGGSPANVAMGLARLDHRVDFACWLGRDPRGERIAAHLARHGVTVLPESFGADPTTTAVATLDAHGAATYDFDLHWDLPQVTIPGGTGHIHTGSIGAVLDPGAASVLAAIDEVRTRGTVSYDPNIRPGIMGDLAAVRPKVEDLIGRSDVVKASDDDLQLLYPDLATEEVLGRWVSAGPGLAVVTRGAAGVMFRVASSDEVTTVPTLAEHVVDTVGAGDSFMAGLVSGLVAAGLLGDADARDRLATATLDDVRPAVERGLATSAVTVGKAGAYAPSLDEL